MRTTVKQKILLALFSGVAIGMSTSPKRQTQILRGLPEAFREIDRRYIKRTLTELEGEGFVKSVIQKDGTVQIILTKHGKSRTEKFQLRILERCRPTKWDKKWRLLIYDVPEIRRKSRDAIRRELKILNFIELQRSVWIYPYDITDILSTLAEIYNLKNELIALEVTAISGEERLKKIFNLK